MFSFNMISFSCTDLNINYAFFGMFLKFQDILVSVLAGTN